MMLSTWRCQMGSQIQSVGWVLAIPVVGLYIFNWKKLRALSKKIVEKRELIRTHLKNWPAPANCCWLQCGARLDAKLSLWAEFRLFLWSAFKYLIEKIFMCCECIVWKQGEFSRTYVHIAPAAANCCCLHSSSGWDVKLGLWAELKPFQWWDGGVSM